MRGTTIVMDIRLGLSNISIHVPREGDDELRLAMVTQMYYISIHVPREGDDSSGRYGT